MIIKNRRREPFRYSFENPLPGFFSKKNQGNISGSLQIEDISLSGLRFSYEEDLELEMRDELILTFIYENQTYSAEGRIIWFNTSDQKTMCGVHVFEYPKHLRKKIEELGISHTLK